MQTHSLDRCPCCGTAHVKCKAEWEGAVVGKDREFWTIVRCQNQKCEQYVLLHYSLPKNGELKIIRAFPGRATNLDISNGVTQEIAAEFAEASLCFSMGCYLSSMTMSRRVLQRCLKTQKHDQYKLVDQIDAAKKSGDIGKRYHLLADEIRHYGNIGAHPDDDNPQLVNSENAKQLLEFVEILIEEFFTLPAKANALRLNRTSPPAASAPPT